MEKHYYIAFKKLSSCKSNCLISKTIALRTRGDVYHTETILPNEDGSWDMCTADAYNNKVRRKLHHFNTSMYIYKKIPATDRDIQIVSNFYKHIDGYGYDFLGILGFMIPIKDASSRWYCSETSSNAMKITGNECMWDRQPSKMSPAGLLNLLDKYNYETIYNF